MMVSRSHSFEFTPVVNILKLPILITRKLFNGKLSQLFPIILTESPRWLFSGSGYQFFLLLFHSQLSGIHGS